MNILISEDGQLIELSTVFAGLKLPLNWLLLRWLLLTPCFICHVSILIYKRMA